MGRLSAENIAAEVKEKGFELIDASEYKSLNSFIKIKCPQNHLIETTLADLRKPSFMCPCCNQAINFENPKNIPAKNGAWRVVAFDQATEKFGISIYDDGKLVFFNLFVFHGDLTNRLIQIKKLIETIVLQQWQPDFIVFEDIQYQNGALLTYKVLAMLLGILDCLCAEYNIPHEIVSPNVWRKYAGTCGKTRREEKLLSIAVVKEKYNITVSDDIAEAILIGQYGARMHKKEIPLAFGRK